MSDKKRKVISTIVTIGVHAIVLLLLMFLTLKIADIKESEDGVPVLLGEVEDAAGDNLNGFPSPDEQQPEAAEAAEEEETEEPSVPEVTKPKAEAKPKAEPKAEKVITQDKEKSIAMETAKKKAEAEAKAKAIAKAKAEAEAKVKAEAEAKKKAAEEAARKKAAAEAEAKRKAAEAEAKAKAEAEAKAKAEAEAKAKAEAAAKAAIRNRMSGAFGNGGNKGSSGNTQGSGSQGSTTGNSNSGVSTGTGGIGAGVSTTIGRSSNLYTPRNTTGQSGTVVVNIVVNSNGTVTSASIASGSVLSQDLRELALSAAKRSSFAEGQGNESGTITYKFAAVK